MSQWITNKRGWWSTKNPWWWHSCSFLPSLPPQLCSFFCLFQQHKGELKCHCKCFFPDFVPKKCEIWERQTRFILNAQLVLFSYNKVSRSSWDLLTLKPGYLISQSYDLSHTSYITKGNIVREDFIINYW